MELDLCLSPVLGRCGLPFAGKLVPDVRLLVPASSPSKLGSVGSRVGGVGDGGRKILSDPRIMSSEVCGALLLRGRASAAFTACSLRLMMFVSSLGSPSSPLRTLRCPS